MIAKLLHFPVGYLNYAMFIKKVTGENNILSTGFIAVANHSSYLDIWAMLIAFYVKKRRYIRFIANKKLTKDLYTQIVYKTLGIQEAKPLFIDIKKPGKEPFKTALMTLKRGNIIGMYPEGERSIDGKIKRGKTGAVRLSLLSRKPIVPVGIQGTFELMPRGKKFPKIRKKIIVNIGKPIYLDRFYKKKITRKLLREITDKIVMKEIAKLSGQKYQQ